MKLYLPVHDEPATGPHQQARAARPVTAETHVLVVEDTAELAETLRRMLDHAGYQVDVTYSPLDALVRPEAGLPVDVVVTDVVMPDLTGPELAAAIHARRPGLPIIYTSGYTAGFLGACGNLAPDAIVLEKPFTRAGLLAAVGRALTGP